ncbi:MAG: SusD/RagB family nutrient-binding outer membrane lipoprotein [Bacteroidota bacterium]|nr:SusD/RagB family nutrient-binding outer membrane lipoprotein [Bacteroidota bacterium]
MKYRHLSLILLATVFLGSCKKEFLDVNTNPNSLPTASPNFVFTNALNTTGSNEVLQNETGSYFAGQWTQSSSYILSSTIFGYQFTNTDFNYYDPIYNNLEDYQYVLDNADQNKQPFLKGPARVMKAYLFQKLVDLYGNVPFTQALKGVGVLAPKFDDQKAIYEALIPMLDTAITDLGKNSFTGAYGSSDIAFNGSTAKWIRFANSLKMRILIRQSRIPGRDAYIIAEIKKAVSQGGGFLNAGEDVGVNPGFVSSDTKLNPFYERFGYNASGSAQGYARFPRPTKYLFDVLIASNDTFRLKRIAYAKGGENSNTPGVSKVDEIVANYVGVPFGAASGYTAPSTSYIGPAVIVKGQFNRPLYLMINSEVQFLLAEAAQRYGSAAGLPNDAKTYYEQGVKESFRLDGVPDATAKANTLLTSGINEADFTASTDKLKAIWMQKWLALTDFEGIEAWTEIRRTHYPPIPKSSSAASNQAPPLRLYYPGTEVNANGENVKAVGTVDVFSTRLFWDIP